MMRRSMREWMRDWWAGLTPTPGSWARLMDHPAAETKEQEIERRLHACEANLANIWEELNARATGDR